VRHLVDVWLTFALLTTSSLGATWDGAPAVLQPNHTLSMPQTPDGTSILTYENLAQRNNLGRLSVTSGGSAPQFYTVPPLMHQPSYLIENWHASNLGLANVSLAQDTPIRVQDVGPGMPGTEPSTIPTDGTWLTLAPGKTAATVAVPRYMQLTFRNTSGDLTEIVLMGGPADSAGNNAYAIELSAQTVSGPPSSTPATPPYYATTTADTYTYRFFWNASTVFVANLSADNAAPLGISLIAL
jgi:hypothetical protein